MAKSDAQVMYCEDADDNDQPIAGSYKYARSNVTSTASSPVKQHQQQQQMNTSRKKSRRTDPASPSFSESESVEHASSTRNNKEKKASTRGKGKVVVEEERRPPARTIKAIPSRPRAADEASYYGVTQQFVASSRPRPSTARPQSYYGQTASSRPPLSHSAHWPPGPPGPLAPNQSSYPPPQWMVSPPLGSSPYGTSPMSGPGYVEYFGRTPDSLASRFIRPEHRPRSATGMRPPSYGPDDYEAAENPIGRRPSLSKRAPKDQEDRLRMPPPSRPQTTQPARRVFKAPPPQRKSVVFPDGEQPDYEPDYQPIVRHPSIDYGQALPIRSRRQSLGREYNHNQGAIEQVPPRSRREKRRSTSYALGNKHDDQIRSAAQYQDEVNGGTTAYLTAENLRAVKNGSSSHSTHSSASHDESSYRQSATTRTTRSGSGDDDITIKLHGAGVVELGNTKINCRKGVEINIPRAGGSSDRGTVYDDDLKSRATRYDRPLARTRSNSQSASTRALLAPPSYGNYAPPHAYQREYAPSPSGYAPYIGYHYEDDGGGYF